MKWLSLLVVPVVVACHGKPETFETTIEVEHVQHFGQSNAPGVMDLQFKYPECPGEVRRLIRVDKDFSQCIGDVKAGDKLPATVSFAWSAERGNYRSEPVKLGNCPLKLDPKEEANYEMVQVCSDLEATGSKVGVHCDRTRPPELIAKCPWLRRQ